MKSRRVKSAEVPTNVKEVVARFCTSSPASRSPAASAFLPQHSQGTKMSCTLPSWPCSLTISVKEAQGVPLEL